MTDRKEISRCTSKYDYETEQCQAVLLADGSIVGKYCGEPCGFVMQKAGHGNPPFNWKRKLFAGDIEIPGQEWQPG